MSKIVNGIYAAVGTPRRDDGTFDEYAFCGAIEFLLERGIRGFALNGATGEYCLTSENELGRMLALASRVFSQNGNMVCGIGSAGIHGCLRAGKIAMAAGAEALLLPMPHFFPYEQDDLEAFCRAVAHALPAPILLYNLPAFTTGLQVDTVRRLVLGCENIVGIKDSSGSLDILRMLTGLDAASCRIVGNDTALAEALRLRLCDGVISGVAGVLPELIIAVCQRDTSTPEFARASRLLDEFAAALGDFPVPWGLKWIGESRGAARATFSQPVSERRQKQARALQSWFTSWWTGNL